MPLALDARGKLKYARAYYRPAPGEMNKNELAYSSHLDLRKRLGEIIDWRWNALKFRIGAPGKNCNYTPDFVVISNGIIECHDTKGMKRNPTGEERPYVEDDAMVKIKAAAELYPWIRWVLVWKGRDGAWASEEV